MWTCTCTCVVPWSISRCTELRSSLRTPDVLKTTSDAACLCSQKRVVSHVEYGAGRALFIGNQSHLAPLQIRAMQTSGTKAKSQKQIAAHCWNTIGMSLRMYAHLSMCRRALQNSQRARIRCNWCACLPEDFSAAHVATKEIFGRAESYGQGEENCSKLVLNRTSWSVVELRRA